MCLGARAPNFEDRSVAAAAWFRSRISPTTRNVGVHLVWLQTPGVDDLFDRIKADNRDAVAASFEELPSNRRRTTRLDLPASDARVVIDRTKELGRAVGRAATLIIDISSLPRTVVRHFLDGIVNDAAGHGEGGEFSQIICLYTAAGDYPLGADADMIGGIEGYYTKRNLHDLIGRAGIIDAFVSMAGTAHDAAQTLDALWSHGSRAKTTIKASIFLNRENFVYSYQRLGHNTWALGKARLQNTDVTYAFETNDVVRRIFDFTDSAIDRHRRYLDNGGIDIPTLLIGGFGPKPIGLASLLARMRYDRAAALRGVATISDVLQVTGWQYTTRYSHGTGAMKAFEVNIVELLDSPPSAD